MRYQVSHITHYHYESSVTLSQQLLHMTPRSFYTQTCTAHRLEINPAPTESQVNQDYFGNITNYFAIRTPHKELSVHSLSDIELIAKPTLADMHNSRPWESVRDELRLEYNKNAEAQAFLFPSPNIKCSEALANYAMQSFTPGRLLIEAAFDLTQRIYQEFEFDPDATDVSTPLSEVLHNKRGVCQDFSHFMIGCLRSLGLACRYVSGYILTTPPQGQPRLVGADASHAWVSVYSPVYGWVDFDPTNNCLVQQEHITVAWGRDFSDISPMHGIVLGGGHHSLDVRVSVMPML
ncbi:transglutaminase [Methylovorus sp. MM2]|uniref:transglutaminase family protein n=1 Tax=Methylovorus sp. MM2 TaxID=1848038 RepID=UPI0007E1BDFB|nr:transglutaminase family protein [Methylovorus sp. MM2]OAM51614.1 transglutaminase [Methylovorus sp. MM2]